MGYRSNAAADSTMFEYFLITAIQYDWD